MGRLAPCTTPGSRGANFAHGWLIYLREGANPETGPPRFGLGLSPARVDDPAQTRIRPGNLRRENLALKHGRHHTNDRITWPMPRHPVSVVPGADPPGALPCPAGLASPITSSMPAAPVHRRCVSHSPLLTS